MGKSMAHLAHLRVYPVKGLDGIALSEAAVLDGGTLAHDREFALFDDDGRVVNGKRAEQIYELSTEFDPETSVLTVTTREGVTARFDLTSEGEQASEWFGEYFDESLVLDRDEELGFVDRRKMGPSVVSTATLRSIASWFDELSVEGVRRRLRANVEIGGVPPFWEDQFVGDTGRAFVAGDVRFEGLKPCGRCVVPQRDPDTGEPFPEFRTRFIEKRRETFPDWADAGAFDHHYAVMILTHIPEQDRGKTLTVGDEIRTVGEDYTADGSDSTSTDSKKARSWTRESGSNSG